LRGRIASILDYSIAKGYRTEANVAEWKGSLKNALPNLSRIAKVQHHPAMPFSDLPDFIAALRSEVGTAARCLELTILCAVRTTEARCAEWSEFDLDAATWTIPAGRIKGDREHRVPLSPRTVAIVRSLIGLHPKYVFLGNKGKPLSDGTMLALLDRMGMGHFTVHGFRSTFRDWSGECTSFPREVCELALSHVNDDETEAAYLRTDFFEKRRALMETWARFAAGEGEPVRLIGAAE
jgi:integrase